MAFSGDGGGWPPNARRVYLLVPGLLCGVYDARSPPGVASGVGPRRLRTAAVRARRTGFGDEPGLLVPAVGAVELKLLDAGDEDDPAAYPGSRCRVRDRRLPLDPAHARPGASSRRRGNWDPPDACC